MLYADSLPNEDEEDDEVDEVDEIHEVDEIDSHEHEHEQLFTYMRRHLRVP
jgi:hypothetical protein